jgi:hypothetical protein
MIVAPFHSQKSNLAIGVPERFCTLSTSVAARKGFVINAREIAYHHFVEAEKEVVLRSGR